MTKQNTQQDSLKKIISSGKNSQYVLSLGISIIVFIGYGIFFNYTLYNSLISNSSSSLNDVINLIFYSIPMIGNNPIIFDISVILIFILTFVNSILLLRLDDLGEFSVNNKQIVLASLLYSSNLIIMFIISYSQFLIIIPIILLLISIYLISESV